MTATNTVPSADAIDIADYLLGCLLSELDRVESGVEKALEDPITADEFLAMSQEAVKARYAERPAPTRADLMPALVFALDLGQAAANMAERAEKLRGSLITLVRRADDETLSPLEWGDRTARIAAWHAKAAERNRAERSTS